ncbi:MAG TPA: PxKF domain-containing protein [Nocardioides sp.]|nr:PxKF domain-containing protein [Nocardioides sp.]
MRSKRNTWGARTAVVAALATGAVLALTGTAAADNITDTIEDDDAPLTLVAGSSTGATASVKLVATGLQQGDPDAACNVDAGDSPLVLDVVTPAGITANPDPVSITGCNDFVEITFTAADDAVSGTATVAILSVPAGGGEFKNNVSIPITVNQPQQPGDDQPPADTTPPAISYSLSPASPDGAHDWYKSNVAVDWTVTDNESSITSSTGCDDFTISTDQAATTYTCSATSGGGTNSVTTVAIKRDATAPTGITFSGLPTAPVYFGDTIGPFGCDATDATSGLDSCTVSGGGGSVGSHTLTATATDNAGNQATATTSYTVLAWTLKGFYAPVDMGGTLNTVKGGSTVPLKFELFAGSRELTDTADVKSFTATKIACNANADLDAVEFTTTGATSLRYDTTAGQFVQNWKVPTGAGLCYRVTMTALDDSSISALFKAK